LQMTDINFMGVDFGARAAGTTAAAFLKEGSLHVSSVRKNEDADKWLRNQIDKYDPQFVFIDAPLSLPLIYTRKISNPDYFYRQADRETKAMSPMFLGGLTARAIKLRDEYLGKKIEFLETYPKKVSETLIEAHSLKYKKKGKLDDYLVQLAEKCDCPLFQNPVNWHEADAVLAWLGGRRYLKGIAIKVGNPEEGIIFF